MTIELLVPPRTQRTPMSCWWACLAMILEYYGHHYGTPAEFRIQFQRPLLRPRSPYGRDLVYPSLERWAERDERLALLRPDLGDRGVRNRILYSDQELFFLQPYEWFSEGLPSSRPAFELLSDITGFRGFANRPAFVHWSAGDIETRLRQHEPYAFFGDWNGFPHAIVTVGLIERGEETDVVTIDPAIGARGQESLASFNRRMGHFRSLDFSSLNPLYLPQSNPVRETVDRA